MDTFEEAYAKYQQSLAQLDFTHDIREKKALFRQLTHQLSDLEKKLADIDIIPDSERFPDDGAAAYWI